MNATVKSNAKADAERIVRLLCENGFCAVYAEDKAKARQLVLERIPKGSSISLGGSMTVESLELLEIFRSSSYRLYDRYQPGLSCEEDHELRRQSMLADFLVTGVNAITETGELFNMDCSGNKTAAMIYGPKNVIVVTGINKLVKDANEAIERLYRIAPLNAKRSGHNELECFRTGLCTGEADCTTAKRMCNYISVINNGRKYAGKYTVIVIPEKLGF